MMPGLRIATLVRYFLYLTVINFVVALGITIPVIVPEFTFPLILTIWPGTWILVSYFVFLIVAVLGSLGWALLLDLFRKYFRRDTCNRYLAFTHIFLTTLGVYGQTTLMFALGYLGGYAVLIGTGRSVVTQGIIGWMVVPIGIFIFLYLLGTVAGIANLILSGPRRIGVTGAEAPMEAV